MKPGVSPEIKPICDHRKPLSSLLARWYFKVDKLALASLSETPRQTRRPDRTIRDIIGRTKSALAPRLWRGAAVLAPRNRALLRFVFVWPTGPSAFVYGCSRSENKGVTFKSPLGDCNACPCGWQAVSRAWKKTWPTPHRVASLYAI